MTDSTDPSDATTELPPTPPEAPLPPIPPAPPAPSAPPAPIPPAPVPMVSPFIPVYKEPWLNPAKRTKAIVAAVVAALVLLGAGFVAGVGVGGHHDRRVGVRIERGVQGGYGLIAPNGPQRRKLGNLPRLPKPNLNNPGVPNASNPPTPAPPTQT